MHEKIGRPGQIQERSSSNSNKNTKNQRHIGNCWCAMREILSERELPARLCESKHEDKHIPVRTIRASLSRREEARIRDHLH